LWLYFYNNFKANGLKRLKKKGKKKKIKENIKLKIDE